MSVEIPEVVASCFRTILGARSDLRWQVFETQAVDAFQFGKIACVSKVEIVDQLDGIAISFGWPSDERQRLISTACERAEQIIEPSSVGELADDDIPRPPEFSDVAIAIRFAEEHTDLRYIAGLGRWFKWTGAKWREDDTLEARDLVRRTCQRVSAACEQRKIAKAVASAKTISGVERLAQAHQKLAARIDQFDVDLFLLNTPSGIVDLRNGEMRCHDPFTYLTKITGVAANPNLPTPNWDEFLRRITGGQVDLVEYLARVAGYSLTGSTQEHSLFFCFGVGANGKSTFLNAITAAAGDYHRAAPIETFTSSSNDRHPTDLAGLRGARLVTAVETEEGRRWAESRIKSLTGGDKIAARFMRQDFFEYTPQFKLIIAGNHKPGLRSVDEAIRRRFNLIPFAVTIPPEERDETLAEKLKFELPGILAWMLRGCADWLERGLAPPRVVIDATAAYLDNEDAVAAWIDDLVERDANSFSKAGDLFASWSHWAEKAGEYVGSQKRFSQAIETRGFAPHRHHQLGRGFRGLRLTDVPVDLEQK